MNPLRPSLALALAALAVPAVACATHVPAAAHSQGSLAISIAPDRTAVTSGGTARATLRVRSTGTEAATAVTACLTTPVQLTVTRTAGAQRTGRRLCFVLGDMAAGAEDTRTLTFTAVADRSASVQFTARATSTCACSGQPTAKSPVIRITSRSGSTPRVTG